MNTDYRDQLLELIADGYISADTAVLMLVKYMTQSQVRDCLRVNEILND